MRLLFSMINIPGNANEEEEEEVDDVEEDVAEVQDKDGVSPLVDDE